MLIPALCVFLCGLLPSTNALNNGLALTPPMGWLSWLRFRCTIDCHAKPKECISENLIKRTADLMVREGYVAAGYKYITIDDCWLDQKRDLFGRLVPDRIRFPNGMKALSDYVHSQGLQFGMYEDVGDSTCAGYPGINGHQLYDADSLASWGVDYLKLDGCYADIHRMDFGTDGFYTLEVSNLLNAVNVDVYDYSAFGRLLNATGRPILYGCSWPMFQESNGIQSNYSAVAENCNIWRNWLDITNSWTSVLSVMDWIGDHQDRLAPFAGPGHWNDPDMLVVGNSGLTEDQARVQMAVWAILAAPLMMSVDLAEIKPEFKKILLNRDVIAVNQDKMGKQGLRVLQKLDQEIWHRELSDGARALAFVNRYDHAVTVTFTHDEMRLPQVEYYIQDLYSSSFWRKRTLKPNHNVTLHINPTGVKFYKFTLKK